MALKASHNPRRWATLAEAAALVLQGWHVLSYGTALTERCVLLRLEV